MKKLMLIALAVLMVFGIAQASVTTTIRGLTAGTPSYTNTYVKWTLSDTTNIANIFLYLRTGTAAFTVVDSLVPTSTDFTDSILVDTLRNNTTYDYYLSILDTTGNDSTYLSWNAWHYSFTTKDYAPHVFLSTNTAYLASNYTGFRVVIDTIGASYTTFWSKIVLEYGLTEATVARWDSVTTTHDTGDSITVDSLNNGATYSYRIIVTFDDGAITLMDTTAFATVTVRDYYPTITEVSFSNDTLILAYDTTTGHTMQSSLLRAFLWVNTSYNNASRCWVKQDSIADTSLGYPDSLWIDSSGVYANPITIIGKRGLTYRYRFITIDSLAANVKVIDTSATDSVFFPDYAFMGMKSIYPVPGTHVERGKLIFNKTGDSPSSGYIPLAGYDYLYVKFKLTGQRDITIPASGTCDSISVYLGCAGMEGLVKFDSLISVVTIDTSAVITKFYDLADTVGSFSSLLSDYLVIWGIASDSSTFADSVLNQRIGNYWIELK